MRVQKALAADAKPDASPWPLQPTSLLVAIEAGQPELVKALIRAGAGACSCDEVAHSKQLQAPRDLHLTSVPASASQDPIAYAKCQAHLQGPMGQLLE